MIPLTVEARNLYQSGESPLAGDVVDSDGSKMLVLSVEGPTPDSMGSIVLRGTSPGLPPPWGKSERWIPDTRPESRNTWLPWRCRLVRRNALGELR